MKRPDPLKPAPSSPTKKKKYTCESAASTSASSSAGVSVALVSAAGERPNTSRTSDPLCTIDGSSEFATVSTTRSSAAVSAAAVEAAGVTSWKRALVVALLTMTAMLPAGWKRCRRAVGCGCCVCCFCALLAASVPSVSALTASESVVGSNVPFGATVVVPHVLTLPTVLHVAEGLSRHVGAAYTFDHEG